MSATEPSADDGSAVDRVYRRTRTAILMGDYPPGFPLRTSELADANGVSAIPVREALRRLEAERLVESVRHKGVRVAQLSMADLADAYQLRTILEIEAVRVAVPKLTHEDHERADELLESMRTLFEAGRVDELHVAHRDLHFIVYERAGSPWLVHVISTLWDHTERYRRLALRWLGQPEDLASAHEPVVEALFSGDVDLAIEAVRAHFSQPRLGPAELSGR
jgi:DNA-binding GntR family transcriptional regulator